MVKSKEIVKIREIENRRLKHFPLYEQTQFILIDRYIFVELVRERKSSDKHSIIKKIAHIIYDMEQVRVPSFLNFPFDPPVEHYRRAFFVNSNQKEEDDHIDPGFTEIYQSLKESIEESQQRAD